MAFKDILLALTSYPAPTPDTSIDCAVALAAGLGAQVTALAFESEAKLMHSPNMFTNMLVDVPQLLLEERAKSMAHAKHLLEYFRASATRQRLTHEALLRKAIAFQVPDAFTEHAKLHDLTIVPLQEGNSVEQWYAEAIIFGSGRPVILMPGGKRPGAAPFFQRVTVAWDSSRPAARALADALPVLEKAKHIQVVTITNEKKISGTHSPADLASHLLKHGLEAKFDFVDAKGRSAGAALADYLDSTGSDFLVMGAYGHSRIKEFILGGATRNMLDSPPVPVLLSH